MTLHPDRAPDKTFAEYVGSGRAAANGRTAHHLFTGYLVAEAGKINLLRESFNPLTMAQAQLPNGVADIGPPGDQVQSFRSSARRVQIRQCGLGR
jgi:hypothetical protein